MLERSIQAAAVALLAWIGCTPSAAPMTTVRDAGTVRDGGTAARDGGRPVANDAGMRDGGEVEERDGGPQPCEDGIQVLHLEGRVLDVHGQPPTQRRFTFCGNACLIGELEADGTFSFDNDFCFARTPPLTRPVFIYHGLDAYSELYFDFVPDTGGAVRIDSVVFEETFRAMPLADMAQVPRTGAMTTLDDGAGFTLTFDDATAEPPFGVEKWGVAELDADDYPNIEGAEELVALYAVYHVSATFDPPATVVFPNHANLPPGTPIDVMQVGDFATEGVYAGTLGKTASAVVSADGASIELEPGEGIRVLTPIGYRPRP